MLTLSRLRKLQASSGSGFTSAYDGIGIIEKYLGVTALAGVNRNIILMANASKCIAGGLTESDAIELFELGWMLDEQDNFFYEL